MSVSREEEKMRARTRQASSRAETLGMIRRKPCAVCKSKAVVAHHEDYSDPMRVDWLCYSHHQQRHMELRGHTDYGVWHYIGAEQPVGTKFFHAPSLARIGAKPKAVAA